MIYLVAGAGGFIGGHLIKRLLAEGNQVIGVDIKPLDKWFQLHESAINLASVDLRLIDNMPTLAYNIDTVINLACDHGGIGYLVDNEFRSLFDITININLLNFAISSQVKNYLFASTACVYNSSLQDDDSQDVYLKESDAWPAMPDMKYGLEKLYGEEMCMQMAERYGINVFLPRIHGCYGPYNHFNDIKEKAPNAILRKALTADSELEIWGTGNQRRSFMYVDDAVEGICRLLDSNWHTPINLGSNQTVTINQVAETALAVAGRQLPLRHIKATVGVNSRSSDNALIQHVLGWQPGITVEQGLALTKPWIEYAIRSHTS